MIDIVICAAARVGQCRLVYLLAALAGVTAGLIIGLAPVTSDRPLRHRSRRVQAPAASSAALARIVVEDAVTQR